MLKDIIIFDIDGTCSLPGYRRKYLEQTPKNWNAYFEQCDKDKPNEPVMHVLRALVRSRGLTKIIFVTGRRESTRKKTLEWFFKHGVIVPSDTLYMRADDDHRHDIQIKPEMVQDFLPRISMVFEDRNSVVKMWRDMGIPCFHVADGNF